MGWKFDKDCRKCINYLGVKDDIVKCLVISEEEMEKRRMLNFLFDAGNCEKYKEIKVKKLIDEI